MRKEQNRSSLEEHRADIAKCVRCGACSTVCPSFLADRRESRSPRGRMALIEGVLEGRLRVSDVYKDRLATCVSCLACESACASGVPFSRIIQAAKEQAVRETGPGIVAGLVSSALKHPALMRSLAWLAPVALHYSSETTRGQGSGVRGQEKTDRGTQGHGDQVKNAQGKARAQVAFFPGCAVRYFQPDIGQAVTTVLEALGFEAVIPEGLLCCGRPYLSLGDRAAAEKLGRKNADILSGLDVEAIVTACASCGLTFKKDYPELLGETGRVPLLDIHEFLADKMAGLSLDTVKMKATWHDPCHLARGQGLAQAARGVLRSVPGIELVEMQHPGRCCGFGGVMRLSHPTLSGTIGGGRAKDVRATEAAVVVTGCPGCRMQIADALKKAGSEARVVHTVQVIAEAIGDRSQETGDRRTAVLLKSGS